MKAILSMVLISFAAIAFSSAAVFSDDVENKGAENMVIDGGKRGSVPFPHHRHQANLGDCKICHSVFPQKPGSINDLKEQGTLKKKYVMNKLCTKCHREAKKTGRRTGPTTCAKCHIRS